MPHDHHDHHHHHHHAHKFGKPLLIAIILNLIFSLVEGGFAIISHSMGLLADAGHNLADVLGLSLAWIANWIQTLRPSTRYTYGYKRSTILAALLNGFVLVALSAVVAYESFLHFFHPVLIHEQTVITIAAIGILVNGGSALLFLKGASDDLNIKGAFLHLLSDALTSVGVIVAGILILWTGKLWIDPLIGFLIVIMILWGTWGLLRDALAFILDAVPANIDEAAVKDFLKRWKGVQAVHDLHIWGLSTQETALTAHLVTREKFFTDQDYAEINQALEKQFKIHHVTLQIETESSTQHCQKDTGCFRIE